MAEIYDYVEGVPGSTVSHILPNGSTKQSKANQLERVIALHEDVQMELLKRGKQVHQRAQFRMDAAQQRHVMRLREKLQEAILEGDPKLIQLAQEELSYYYANKTQVTFSQADIDVHIGLYRPDGKELHVEIDNAGGRGGLNILKQSMTG